MFEPRGFRLEITSGYREIGQNRMSSLLPTTKGAILRKVVPYTVHGQPHLQVFYSPVGQEHRTFEARLGSECVYSEIAEGDQVSLHVLMNMITKIEKV